VAGTSSPLVLDPPRRIIFAKLIHPTAFHGRADDFPVAETQINEFATPQEVVTTVTTK